MRKRKCNSWSGSDEKTNPPLQGMPPQKAPWNLRARNRDEEIHEGAVARLYDSRRLHLRPQGQAMKKDYELSKEIVERNPDYTFPALIMAAARKSTPQYRDRLLEVFPDIVLEYSQRYHSPGGRLPGDRE